MKKLVVSSMIALLVFAFGCQKEKCFDKRMAKEHSGICTEDCPGVCGCDGNTYCNECEANRYGIRVIKDRACDQ